MASSGWTSLWTELLCPRSGRFNYSPDNPLHFNMYIYKLPMCPVHEASWEGGRRPRGSQQLSEEKRRKPTVRSAIGVLQRQHRAK